MADVKKVVNFDSPKQFKEMGQDILQLTRTIPMAGEEIAAIVAAGGQAGIAREYLLGYAQDAAKMGVAFDMAAGDAGTAMATMANVLGKPIKEMARFGDVINHLSDNANAKAADIVNVIARAGSDTRMLGLYLAQVRLNIHLVTFSPVVVKFRDICLDLFQFAFL
ncbi:phage tail tape measure protein [Pasteurellaceae bacterium 22721_9_1]